MFLNSKLTTKNFYIKRFIQLRQKQLNAVYVSAKISKLSVQSIFFLLVSYISHSTLLKILDFTLILHICTRCEDVCNYDRRSY